MRTLLLAERILEEDEYQNWAEMWHAASVAMDDRDAKVEEAMEVMERDLRLVFFLFCFVLFLKFLPNLFLFPLAWMYSN